MSAVILLLIYPFLLIPYVTDAPITGVIKEIRDYAYYIMDSTLMVILIYAFTSVEKNESNLKKIVEMKSKQLIEAEKLAAVGDGVVRAEQEIRNPPHTHLAGGLRGAGEGDLNPDMIRVIRENIVKINKILTDLRVQSGVK